MDLNVGCRKALISGVVVSLADFLHPIVMGHVQSLVRVDSALGVGLPAHSRVVLVIEDHRTVRVVCLRVESTLT